MSPDRVLGVLALLAVLSRAAARLPAAVIALGQAHAAALRLERVLRLPATLRRPGAPPAPASAPAGLGPGTGSGAAGGSWKQGGDGGGGVELRDVAVGWVRASEDGAGEGRERGEGAGEAGWRVWRVLEELNLRVRGGVCTVMLGEGKTALLLAMLVRMLLLALLSQSWLLARAARHVDDGSMP